MLKNKCNFCTATVIRERLGNNTAKYANRCRSKQNRNVEKEKPYSLSLCKVCYNSLMNLSKCIEAFKIHQN